jgi:putative transposase
VIGLDCGEAETEAFWRDFLRSLVKRGLTGVQLIVSDAHEGLKNAIAQVLGCPWQRCTVHFLREALGHVRKEQQGMVAALIRPIFNADQGQQARELVGEAISRLERPLPKVAAMLERAEEDLLAFYASRRGRTTARPAVPHAGVRDRDGREHGVRVDGRGRAQHARLLLRARRARALDDRDRHAFAVLLVAELAVLYPAGRAADRLGRNWQ